MLPAYQGAIDIPKTISTTDELLDWLLGIMSENARLTGSVLASQGEINSWRQAWLRIKNKEDNNNGANL